jgi:hypothetical protein
MKSNQHILNYFKNLFPFIVDNDSLTEEKRQLREQRLCKTCFDMEATIAFLPCGHIASCSDYAPAMRKCLNTINHF